MVHLSYLHIVPEIAQQAATSKYSMCALIQRFGPATLSYLPHKEKPLKAVHTNTQQPFCVRAHHPPPFPASIPPCVWFCVLRSARSSVKTPCDTMSRQRGHAVAGTLPREK